MNFFKKVSYTTAEETIENVRAAVLSNKLVHLADFREEMPVQEFYSKLSETIGRIQAADEDLATGKLTGNRWIDITYNPEIPDRYRSSKTGQPLHTDDSYIELYGEVAVNFFFCDSRAKFGGATTFFDLPDLVACLQLDGEDELMAELMQTEVVFSKGGARKVRKILDQDSEGYLANWNYFCIDRKKTRQQCLICASGSIIF
jgi:alpha-ketoglutarate-dependent taurine dioxygenase